MVEALERSAEKLSMGKIREKKRKVRGFRTFAALLGVSILILTASLLAGSAGENREYQFVVSLGGMEYDESFLEKAAKIKGICQASPVLEIPVQLKIGDYTMDTLLQAVDIEALDKKVKTARETPLGDTLVLLLGKDSLGEMRDFNDHVISSEQQKRFLEDYEKLEAEIFVDGEGASGYTSKSSPGAESKAGQWRSCIVAGVLDAPAAGIYLPFWQGEALLGGAGKAKIEKALLTVRGKTNYEKALEMFTL